MSKFNTSHLRIGMQIEQDVFDKNHLLIASAGDNVSERLIEKLNTCGIEYVYVKDITPNHLDDTKRELLMNRLADTMREYQLLKSNVFDRIALPASECLHNIILEDDALIALKSLADIDDYTFNHSVHVGMLSGLIAHLLEYPHSDICDVIYAGIFHDVGKLSINTDILLKPNALSESEFDEVKKHAVYAIEYINQLPFVNDTVATAIAQHHERLDGTGYPGGLKADAINQYAKIVAVADIYDASVSNKCYAHPLSPFDACEDLFDISLDAIDPAPSQALIRFIQKRYVGQRVELSNGEIGEVVFANKFEPNRPLIKSGDNFYDLSTNKQIRVSQILD